MINIKLRDNDMGCLAMMILFPLLIVLALALPALIIMLAWNELLVDLVKSLRTITFWEALLMSLVLNIIFRPFRRH